MREAAVPQHRGKPNVVWRRSLVSCLLPWLLALPFDTAFAVGMGLEDARHLLARTTFGPSIAQVRAYSTLTREQAVRRLLDEPAAAQVLPAPSWVTEPLTPLRVQRNATPEERRRLLDREAQRGLELRSWWLGEMLASQAQLRERMTLFWHGHFTTSQQKVRQIGRAHF